MDSTNQLLRALIDALGFEIKAIMIHPTTGQDLPIGKNGFAEYDPSELHPHYRYELIKKTDTP